jgi:uncharacterized protein YndB with AHSA1/START domain
MVNEPIVIERNFDAPMDLVWLAITQKDQIKEWSFDIKSFEAVVGFEFQFEGGTERKTYLHRCRVTEVKAGKKLQYSWRYEGYGGQSTVTFELFPSGDQGTRLKLTHEGLESFPKENPDFAKENFYKGWTQIIGESLKNFVEKK